MTISKEYINTFSIVGYDPETGGLGVAVASKFLAAGAVVPFAKAGVGAIATQSWANTQYGREGLELLEKGLSPQEVIEQLTGEDADASLRQVGMVDTTGKSSTFTGEECYDWAGGIAGTNFACQGNILVDEKTVKAMADAFQTTEGSLAERLLEALHKGEQAGGDSRGKQSASLLIVKEAGGYGGFDDKYIDLRVDDHKEPVVELKRIFSLHQLYFKKADPNDILKIEGEVKTNVVSFLSQLDYLKEGQEVTDEVLFEAVKSFHLIENFDERVQEPGLIDAKVLQYMEQLIPTKA